MAVILAQIAPQRSTQYTKLASTLAPHELALSSLGPQISEIDPLELGGQTFLRFETTTEPDEDQVREMGTLAMTNAFFFYYERLGEHPGPFFKPVEIQFQPCLPPELVMARRYRGKTNEMFTHFLCNVAKFSSGYAHRP